MREIIELSHRMAPGKSYFKIEAKTWDVTEQLPEVKHRPEIWYVIGEFTVSTHAGTHVEFPFHHWKGGADGADFPIQNLIGEAIVLDFHEKQDGEAVTLDEVKAHEGRIKEGDIIFIRTDKDKLFFTERWNEQPYLTPEACDWLLNHNPKVMGTDAAGFELPGTDYQPNHLNLFRRGMAMIESATNLAAIGEDRVDVFILPLPIEGIDACPVRIIALR
jgi:arylformamidase